MWLASEGFERVFVLRGGLAAWKGAGLPTVPIGESSPLPAGAASPLQSQEASPTHVFLPGLVENYARQQTLPLKRVLTVLFVDIADSTAAVTGKSPEQALAFVQRFMGIVTDAALASCGDVKDYEGDGALLYFESVSEATRAALMIRDALSLEPPVEGTRLRARMSLDTGDMVIGVIGTPLRRSVALIGPAINRAARLLKQIPPEGIIATDAVVRQLGAEAPALAELFALHDEALELRGFESELVRAHSI